MTPAPQTEIAADIQALNTLHDQYSVAFNSHDAAALAVTQADNAIYMGANQAAVEGKRAIQSAYEAYFNQNAAKYAHTPQEIQLAGDWAYERGNATITVTPNTGQPAEESIKYLVICKRQPNGAWKYYRVIYNSNAPPPAAAGQKK